MTDQDWKMPYVPQCGELVLFSSDPKGHDGYAPAFVRGVGEKAIEVFAPFTRNNAFRDNVRHKDDPKWKEERYRQQALEDDDSGVFQPHPIMLAFKAMTQKLATIEARLNGTMTDVAAEEPKVEVAATPGETYAKNRNKGGRPKKPDPNAFKPAVYDAVPVGVDVVEIEEDDES